MSKLIAVLKGEPPRTLKRAAAAANAHLGTVNVTADQAALGAWKREGWDVSGMAEDQAPTNDEMRWAEAWDGAYAQAAKIILESYSTMPADFGLEVKQENEEGPAQTE